MRNEILIIVPPNTNTVIDGRLMTVTNPEEHSDWSDFASLGALGMVSALSVYPYLRPKYIDCTIIPFSWVLDYIKSNSATILAIGVGALTANYEAALLLFKHAKSADERIATIIGADHFTALPTVCISKNNHIDYGFFGNEVVGPFVNLINRIYHKDPIIIDQLPGLVHRRDGRVVIEAPKPEPVFSGYNLNLIDSWVPHRERYARGFRKRVAPRVKELLGRDLYGGVTLDIGRGCLKFASNSPCSFCSIQYGSLWRNQLSYIEAWEAIRLAWEAGYDYLYITADELPLTFSTLLRQMRENMPPWWVSLKEEERPLLVGYARADGVADPKRANDLVNLGIRQVMIGMDAGSPISLAAMNKPLKTRDKDKIKFEAEALYRQNFDAIDVARNEGLLIRSGFVMGHIGMTKSLLEENIQMMEALIKSGADTISALDIEVLSPQPGSPDFSYLVTPDAATAAAKELDLELSDLNIRKEIASNWESEDIIVPEQAMRDYVQALMPELTFEDLAEGRRRVRAFAKSCGVIIGEPTVEVIQELQ